MGVRFDSDLASFPQLINPLRFLRFGVSEAFADAVAVLCVCPEA